MEDTCNNYSGNRHNLAFRSLSTAQVITGVPGSPSATTTIHGDQLPPPAQVRRQDRT